MFIVGVFISSKNLTYLWKFPWLGFHPKTLEIIWHPYTHFNDSTSSEKVLFSVVEMGTDPINLRSKRSLDSLLDKVGWPITFFGVDIVGIVHYKVGDKLMETPVPWVMRVLSDKLTLFCLHFSRKVLYVYLGFKRRDIKKKWKWGIQVSLFFFRSSPISRSKHVPLTKDRYFDKSFCRK